MYIIALLDRMNCMGYSKTYQIFSGLLGLPCFQPEIQKFIFQPGQYTGMVQILQVVALLVSGAID